MSATLFEMDSQTEEQQQTVCLEEQQLVVGMTSLELSESVVTPGNCDGSDSGLDVASCCHSRITLQRGLSSTSGGYTSSNGLEEIYDSCELKVTTVAQTPSETGSEKTSPPRRTGSVKKKVAMFEPEPTGTPAKDQLRGRVANLKRAESLPRNSAAPGTPGTPSTHRDKARLSTSSFRVPSTTGTPSSSRLARPQKPDTLPNALNRAQSVQRLTQVQRTPSLSRARTPGTPSDDGRWPANRGAARRGMSVTPEVTTNRMRGSPAPGGTLPRRRKQQSVEDLTGGRLSRSNSISRAAIVDARMTSSVMVVPTSRRSLAPAAAKVNSLRRPQPATPRTRIYHETAVQTALTSEDLEQVLGGGLLQTRAVDAVEQRNQSTQAEPDQREFELEQLRQEVRQLSGKLQREREEKLAMQQELHLNTERVMGMLELARVVSASAGTPTSEDSGDGSGHDSLLMLESQIQISGHELFERQQEIGQLRSMCRALQLEMRRSLATQQLLLQEKAAIEQESSELQDFLQHEKAAQCDALRDLEADYQAVKLQLANREEEAKVLRDECRHLVRLNEQRRQENRLLQTKFTALENKSRELIHQQNASVAGASTALSGLHSRLDGLVEQLVYSYSISEQDLEVGFYFLNTISYMHHI